MNTKVGMRKRVGFLRWKTENDKIYIEQCDHKDCGQYKEEVFYALPTEELPVWDWLMPGKMSPCMYCSEFKRPNMYSKIKPISLELFKH